MQTKECRGKEGLSLLRSACNQHLMLLQARVIVNATLVSSHGVQASPNKILANDIEGIGLASAEMADGTWNSGTGSPLER